MRVSSVSKAFASSSCSSRDGRPNFTRLMIPWVISGCPHLVAVLVEVEMLEMSPNVSAIHRPLLLFRVERIISYPRDPCCEVSASTVFANSSEDQNLVIKETLR